jgi:hypothetical protein
LDAAIAENSRMLANKVLVKINPGLQYKILDGDNSKGKQMANGEVIAIATIEGKGEITGVLRGVGKRRSIETVEMHPEGSYYLRI